jgi:hypothetical protein
VWKHTGGRGEKGTEEVVAVHYSQLSDAGIGAHTRIGATWHYGLTQTTKQVVYNYTNRLSLWLHMTNFQEHTSEKPNLVHNGLQLSVVHLPKAADHNEPN